MREKNLVRGVHRPHTSEKQIEGENSPEMRKRTFFEGTSEAEAMRSWGEHIAIMKAVQSGLGLKERSVFSFSHTRWVLKKDGEAEQMRDGRPRTFDVSPPSPSSALWEDRLWFPHTSGLNVLSLSQPWQPYLTSGMNEVFSAQK